MAATNREGASNPYSWISTRLLWIGISIFLVAAIVNTWAVYDGLHVYASAAVESWSLLLGAFICNAYLTCTVWFWRSRPPSSSVTSSFFIALCWFAIFLVSLAMGWAKFTTFPIEQAIMHRFPNTNFIPGFAFSLCFSTAPLVLGLLVHNLFLSGRKSSSTEKPTQNFDRTALEESTASANQNKPTDAKEGSKKSTSKTTAGSSEKGSNAAGSSLNDAAK